MISILEIITPVVALIGVGYLAVWLDIIPQQIIPGLGKLVLYFCLPALIFSTLANVSLEDAVDPFYLTAYGLGSLATFLIAFSAVGLWTDEGLSHSTLAGLGTSFSNSAFIAYPILIQMFGTLPAGAFSMSLIVENLLMLPLSLLILEYASTSSNHGAPRRHILKSLIKRIVLQPVLIAIVLGLLASHFDIGLPNIAERSLDLLSDASAGLALFAIGGSLAGKKIRGDMRIIGLIAGGKLILHPLLVALFIWILPPFDRNLQIIAVLIAAMPMLSIYPVIAANYISSTRYASALVITTLLSAVTISIVLAISGR